MYQQVNKRLNASRQRGVALLAVMMAVVVAFILSTAFLSRQSTAVAVGENKKDHTAARHIAESTIEWALEYLNSTEEWRDLHSEGAWLTDEDMLGGTVTLYVYDGEDEDGDGVIDSDGDLSDDASEKITLIAIARHNGLRHEARSVVQPAVEDSLGTLLLLVGQDPLSSDDLARQALFEEWGWTVITVEDVAPTSEYNVALAMADVVYFSEDCDSWQVGARLDFTNTIGIVNEETHFNDDLKISTTHWNNSTGSEIEISSTPHYITQPFAIGDLQITSGTMLCYEGGTLAPGAVNLATRSGSSNICFLAIETGSELVDGSLAAGRRVTLPYGSQSFDFTSLTDSGKEVIERSLYWAARGHTNDHLVAHWKLDQTSGQVAVDSSSNGNHATLTNVGDGAEWVFGQVNNAIDFDGAGLAYARAPDSDSLDLEHEGTIAAWIKPESITNFMGIVHKGELTNWTDEAYSLQFWTGQKLALTFHTTTGGSARCYGNQVLSTDTWYHVVGTWNSAGMRIYVDGALDASNTEAYVASTSDGSVQIGSQLTSWYNSTYKNLPFNGLIDDVRIYNRSLIESEIEAIYESVVSPEEAPTLIAEYTFDEPDPLDPQIVGHWQLDESAAAPGDTSPITAVDGTGNQNGSAVSTTAGEAGVFGSAHLFDGVSSYVLLDHNALQAPDDGVVCFWFQVDQTSGQQGLVSKDSSSFDNGGQVTVYADGDRLKATLESSLTDYELSASGLVAGQWHHAALSFGPEGAMLYLDGVLEDTDIYNGGLGTSSGGMGNTEPWVFGASTASSGNGTHTPLSNFLAGKMDDVRFYDAQLSVTQLSAVIAGTELVAEPQAIVEDTSGYGGAMDLVIDNLVNVNWLSGGGLEIDSSTVIGSADASKLYDALTATDQVTLEIVYTPDSVDPGTESAVAGMISSESALNVAVLQDAADASGMVRTSATGASGTPAVSAEDSLGALVSTHLILSYDGENVRLYKDGSIVATEERSGGLSWSLAYGFYVGNLANGTMPMTGRLSRVAVYDKGVNLLQAQNIFLGKPPGLPSGDETVAFSRVWYER